MEDYMKYDGRVPEPPYPTPTTEDYMAAHIESLEAERDRLAAENAELKALCIDNTISVLQDKLSALNATLDRLREVVPEVLPPHMSWKDALDGARAILYPKETNNG